MDWFAPVDWQRVLLPTTPLLEILVRGSLTYLALFLLLRMIHKREAAGMSVTDLLVLVLIADAAQNAMAGDYHSIADGVLLVAVIVGWAWLLDWASYRSSLLERLMRPPKLPLVRDGRLLRRNMRRELITLEELESQLRLQGVERIEDVKEAFVEPDGRVSVLRADEQPHAEPPRRPPV